MSKSNSFQKNNKHLTAHSNISLNNDNIISEVSQKKNSAPKSLALNYSNNE